MTDTEHNTRQRLAQYTDLTKDDLDLVITQLHRLNLLGDEPTYTEDEAAKRAEHAYSDGWVAARDEAIYKLRDL